MEKHPLMTMIVMIDDDDDDGDGDGDRYSNCYLLHLQPALCDDCWDEMPIVYMRLCPIVSACAGFIVDFIPPPVISGFTSAAAITIATSQIKVLLCVFITKISRFIVCTCV